MGAAPDPDTIRNPVVPDSFPPRRAELEFLASRGLPPQWIRHCGVRDWIGDDPRERTPAPDADIDFFVGGEAPPRTVAELVAAAEMGLGLYLVLESDFDLSLIEPAIAQAVRLGLGSRGALRGWGVLAVAGRVEFLSVAEPSEPLQIGELPHLERFSGLGKYAAYAAENRTLRHLTIDMMNASWPDSVVVGGPLEYLHLMNAKRVGGLPHMRVPDALTSLRLVGPDLFDADSLRDARSLEWLDLASCRRVVNVDALTTLDRLEFVELTDVKAIDGWETLIEVRANRLVLTPNHVVPDDVAQSWTRGSAGRWHIARRKPTRRVRR